MSHVILLAADRPLPLYDAGICRERTSADQGYTVTMEVRGFAVRPHSYYRQAVDELGLPMKPCRYELDLEVTPEDVQVLRDYLERNLSPGEQAELWSVWVPSYPEDRLTRYRGRLEDLGLETVNLLNEWNICITVER